MSEKGEPKASLLIIDDDATLNRLVTAHLRRCGYDVASAATWAAGEEQLSRMEPDLTLLDMRLPDAEGIATLPAIAEICPVIVLTAFGSIDLAVKAIKLGATDFLTKPINPEVLEIAISRALSARTMRRSYEYYREKATSSVSSLLVGRSAAMAKLRRMIGIVGPSNTTVLVLGESGVGKELVAAAVHQASERASKPFVAVDCATLHENLFESALFGHERGAFTGADRRKEGLIEVAEGGTVFLDEIGEMSAPLQAKLLRVLETARFRRLGGVRDLSANVRFVAATNRNLDVMRRAGSFREDLYYRLSAFVLDIPPLRERLNDVPLLAEHFLAERDFNRQAPKRWSASALEVISTYHWPGNVRELRNLVERAALVAGNASEIRPAHITGLALEGTSRRTYNFSFDHLPTIEGLTEMYLDQLCADPRLNRRDMARILGISERSLYRLLGSRRPVGGEAGVRPAGSP
jgi:DNA-binding NtrC family response regulator